MAEYDAIVNVVLVGEASVGKTALIQRFLTDSFESTLPTLGVDLHKKLVTIDDKGVVVRLFDTAGQEKFRSVTDDYFRKANGVVMVYDVTQKDTFHSLSYWLAKVRETSPANVKIMLIGNKIDLIERREIGNAEGLAFAQQNQLFFTETSALSDEGGKVGLGFMQVIEEAGRQVLIQLQQETNSEIEKERKSVPVIVERDKKSRCC